MNKFLKRQEFKKFADKKYKHTKFSYTNVVFTSSITDVVEEVKKSDLDA
jgi:hypothetical protein